MRRLYRPEVSPHNVWSAIVPKFCKFRIHMLWRAMVLSQTEEGSAYNVEQWVAEYLRLTMQRRTGSGSAGELLPLYRYS